MSDGPDVVDREVPLRPSSRPRSASGNACFALRAEELPERAAAADEVLPQARLALVDAERDGLARAACRSARPAGPGRRGRGRSRAGRRRTRRRSSSRRSAWSCAMSPGPSSVQNGWTADVEPAGVEVEADGRRRRRGRAAPARRRGSCARGSRPAPSCADCAIRPTSSTSGPRSASNDARDVRRRLAAARTRRAARRTGRRTCSRRTPPPAASGRASSPATAGTSGKSIFFRASPHACWPSTSVLRHLFDERRRQLRRAVVRPAESRGR